MTIRSVMLWTFLVLAGQAMADPLWDAARSAALPGRHGEAQGLGKPSERGRACKLSGDCLELAHTAPHLCLLFAPRCPVKGSLAQVELRASPPPR
jgi:hypothetical protein